MAQIRSLILRITERCNLHCDYCYAACHSCPTADMSPQTARDAVSLCCPEGGQLRIQFTGGEPLLNWKVMESVATFGAATNRNLLLSVQTNGTLLTPEICRKLAAMHCAVGVSLDGLGKANALRHFPDGTPAYDSVVSGIRNLGQAGLRCNLTTVVTRCNASYLGQLPDLALWLGNVRGVGLDLFRPLGRGADLDLSPEAPSFIQGLRELMQKTKEIQSAGIPFRLRELERLKKRRSCAGCDGVYCYAQTPLSLCIDPGGNCWPCSSLAGDVAFFLGNIRDGLPQSNASRDALSPPEVCRSCPSFSLCGGGCPAGRIGGMPQPVTCTMNQILWEEYQK